MLNRWNWVVAVLAAVALTAGVVAAYADRAVFDADGFAERVDASLRSGPVSAELSERLTVEVINAQPDLVAVQPLINSVAETIVRGAPFRSLARGAARDVHRSIFDQDAATVTLTVADTGVLVREALARLRPDLARSIPPELPVRVSAAASDAETAAVEAAAFAERVRRIALLGLVVFALLAALAVWRGRRPAVLRLGVAVAVVAGATAVLAVATPRILFEDAAARAVLATWLDPLAAWCAATAAAGAIAALAAAAILRPVALLPALWAPAPSGLAAPSAAAGGAASPSAAAAYRAPAGAASPSAAAAPPASTGAAVPPRATAPPTVSPGASARALFLRSPVWVRAVAAVAVGAVFLREPQAVLELAVMGAGLLLVLAGASELLRLAGDPPARRIRRIPRRVRIGALSAALLAAVGAVAFAAGNDPEPVFVGRCNGSAELCDRRLDEISMVGTHNSMSAAGEPGWLFAAQDAGIEQQLRDGVRSLLIDTHYGFATPRGVATDLTRDSKSREKIEREVGPRFVETAQRLRSRIGFTGDEPREVFLCHAFCEVGATLALEALQGVHRFLVAHPEEVLILSIEDDTEAETTAKLIRDSGLIHEVYRGPAKPPWPTLREMIERNERVLVLIENEPGDEPWMHKQSEVAQETPYHFGTAAELDAADSCRPNRGGTTGSLLLVNHWVDTSPAPRTSIAREVNARPFLTRRLARCREERGLVPNIVAVDFYRQGDVAGTLAAER